MSALVILHVPTFHPVLLGASAVPTHCFICHFSVKSQYPARSPEAAVFTVGSSTMLSLSVIFQPAVILHPQGKFGVLCLETFLGFTTWWVVIAVVTWVEAREAVKHPPTYPVPSLTTKNYPAQNINRAKVEKPWTHLVSTLPQRLIKKKALLWALQFISYCITSVLKFGFVALEAF